MIYDLHVNCLSSQNDRTRQNLVLFAGRYNSIGMIVRENKPRRATLERGFQHATGVHGGPIDRSML